MEGVMDIITNEGGYNYQAKMMDISRSLNFFRILQCGPLTIEFVNEKKIFAEIFLIYNEQSVKYPKIETNLKITFGKNNIILNHNNKQEEFSYNEHGINLLQQSILMLNNKIHFKVVKIYESNLPKNRTLAHSTVYELNIKIKLEMLEKLSLWKYVKEEIVNCDISTQPYITLEDFINNSTTYNKYVAFTLQEALRIMNDRTFKYAFLLVIYAYMTLKNDFEKTIDWESFQIVSKKLSTAQIYPIISNNIHYDLRSDFPILQKGIESGQCEEIVKKIMLKYTKLFLTPMEINDLARTRRLSQNVLNKVFRGFPKPHENDVISYNFETIPNRLNDIKTKLEIILRLINTEYKEMLNITYYIKVNQLTHQY
ncbi:uncharacterized protein LOC126906972 isoform X2 [Daktulosphaira vitifoliae]|uniref:uncharacterized protein LOC126906972 isoform X2 n=1 Tax=Daktulosphaira vitifoliae TaxID=58002 RepID=UPI0021A9C2BA|nr:uncharacterized protein LOC126906972 isoform X2 [Daktulosphaira vitifoliae]